MYVLQRPRNPVLLDDLAVKAIRKEDRFEGTNPARNGRRVWVRPRFEMFEGLGGGGRQDDVRGPWARYSRGPLRIPSRSSSGASGGEINPLLPSAFVPWFSGKLDEKCA